VRTICRRAERIRQAISYELPELDWHQETAARPEGTGKCANALKELLSRMADEMEDQRLDQDAKAEAEAQYTEEGAMLEEKWTSAWSVSDCREQKRRR
jgi:hypothetical protein